MPIKMIVLSLVVLIAIAGAVAAVPLGGGSGEADSAYGLAPIPGDPNPDEAPAITVRNLPSCDSIETPAHDGSLPTAPPTYGTASQPGNILCGVTPTQVDTPQPAPQGGTAYRHMGAEVANNRILQVWGHIEVTNPSVPMNNGEDHHFVARFLAKKQVSGIGCPTVGAAEVCWIEAGWGEFESAGNARYVYTHSTDEQETYRYESLSLTDGQEYAFAVRYEGEDPPLWGAYVWWGGQWVCLRDESGNCGQSLGFSYAGDAEQYAEVATTSQSGDFAIQDTAFGDGSAIRIQVNDSLDDWTSSNFGNTVPRSNVGDYSVTWTNNYDDWSVDD